MSEWLLNALQEAIASHGLRVAREDDFVVSERLRLQPRVLIRGETNGTTQVQVDFKVESPRLDGLPMLDSFAGIGSTLEEAESNAFDKFLRGSLHVLLESLSDHRCGSDQVEWEDWRGERTTWQVCSGPLLLIATRPAARIEGFADFFEQLTQLFIRDMTAGPHWMRVFLGVVDGELRGREVLVDGAEWAAAEDLLERHAWVYPPGYASLRHLLIALPR